MELNFGVRARRQWRARRAARSVIAPTPGVEVIIRAARLVVSTRFASSTLLERRLDVSPSEARAILRRLEHCEVIAPSEGAESHGVLTTSHELPGVIEEFAARG